MACARVGEGWYGTHFPSLVGGKWFSRGYFLAFIWRRIGPLLRVFPQSLTASMTPRTAAPASFTTTLMRLWPSHEGSGLYLSQSGQFWIWCPLIFEILGKPLLWPISLLEYGVISIPNLRLRSVGKSFERTLCSEIRYYEKICK